MNAKHLLSISTLISCIALMACNNNENNDIVEEKKTLAQQLYIYKSYEEDQGFNNESIGGIFKLYNESPDSYTHISVHNYYCVTDCEDFLSEDEKQNMYQSSSLPIDTLYLSGLKNNRLWVAAYNTVSKKKLFEMTSSNTIETEYVKHMGYGEYKTLNLELIRIGYRGDSNHNDYWWYTDKYKAIRFLASYSSENNEWDSLPHIILAQNESCQVIQSDYMIPWYNDSFLFEFKKENNYDAYTTFYGYYENGEYNTPMIDFPEYCINVINPDVLYDGGRSYVVPFDYDKYIKGTISGNDYSIDLYTLIRGTNPYYFDFEYYDWEPKLWIDLGHQEKNKDKVTMKILEKDYNGMEWIWKIQLNILRYDGEQINDEYVISLYEGKIIEHNGKAVQE